MITNLRQGGLPISAMADAMRVERKTIYSWLNGSDIRSANNNRVSKIHALLCGVEDVDLRSLYRFWNADLDDKNTLRSLMTAENIDSSAVRAALNKLRPAALRAMQNDQKMSRQGNANPVLDDISEAGENV
jgi:hypothetical protein